MSKAEIIEKYHHFKIKTANGIELDLIETKYYKELLDLYKKEKEENGKLRVELEQEKEKNKKLEEYITDKIEIEDEIQTYISEKFVEDQYISKDKIKEKIKMYKLVYNPVSARTLELLLEEK